MASAIIHMCVAKKVNEVIKQDERPYMLGSIAPDIAKMVGSERRISHFTNGVSDAPQIDIFLKKYKAELNKPFEIGYFVHLLTDVLWSNEFIKNHYDENKCLVIDKEGNKVKVSDEEYKDLMYNDYSNLNVGLVDYYNLDYSLFYENFDYPESHIKELPSIYLGALVSKMGIICSNMGNYSYLLDLANVTHFIEYATIYVLDELKKYGICF